MEKCGVYYAFFDVVADTFKKVGGNYLVFAEKPQLFYTSANRIGVCRADVYAAHIGMAFNKLVDGEIGKLRVVVVFKNRS